MSHFFVMVLLKPGTEDVEGEVQDLLAPYDENTEVEKYEVECWCTRDHKLPDNKCESCKGTGFHDSTRNPKSKWDWYQVGGRWTGHLSNGEYDPNTDPKNIEECNLCNGTGTRVVPITNQPDWKPKEGDCNGCEGKGTRVKWPTQWAEYKGDVALLSSLLEDVIPFALVTPDGEWHERGEMGWWGAVHEEKHEEDWSQEARRLMKAQPDGTIAVVVDCHI